MTRSCHTRRGLHSALAGAAIILLLTISLPAAYAGDVDNPTTPRPGPQGWLASPLSVAASTLPPWALQAAQNSVSTAPSDPSFPQDVTTLAIRIYQECLALPGRCQPAPLAAVPGQAQQSGLVSTRGVQPDAPSSVWPGTPFYNTSGTARNIMINKIPAPPNADTVALVEPNGSDYVNYCGPGAARVAAYSYDGAVHATANSFNWYGTNISGFSSSYGTPYNAYLVDPINADISSKVGTTPYGAGSAPDPNVRVFQAHLGVSIYVKSAPMLVSGTTNWLPSWSVDAPNVGGTAHIFSLWSYDFMNGRSRITYDDTANVGYAGNIADGPITTDLNHIYNAVSTCTLSGCGDVDVDVW